MGKHGKKYICRNRKCGEKFYDLNGSELICPYCGTEYDTKKVNVRTGLRARNWQPPLPSPFEEKFKAWQVGCVEIAWKKMQGNYAIHPFGLILKPIKCEGSERAREVVVLNAMRQAVEQVGERFEDFLPELYLDGYFIISIPDKLGKTHWNKKLSGPQLKNTEINEGLHGHGLFGVAIDADIDLRCHFENHQETYKRGTRVAKVWIGEKIGLKKSEIRERVNYYMGSCKFRSLEHLMDNIVVVN
jgi:Protein of unknown function (FYDLN_acid)